MSDMIRDERRDEIREVVKTFEELCETFRGDLNFRQTPPWDIERAYAEFLDTLSAHVTHTIDAGTPGSPGKETIALGETEVATEDPPARPGGEEKVTADAPLGP